MASTTDDLESTPWLGLFIIVFIVAVYQLFGYLNRSDKEKHFDNGGTLICSKSFSTPVRVNKENSERYDEETHMDMDKFIVKARYELKDGGKVYFEDQCIMTK